MNLELEPLYSRHVTYRPNGSLEMQIVCMAEDAKTIPSVPVPSGPWPDPELVWVKGKTLTQRPIMEAEFPATLQVGQAFTLEAPEGSQVAVNGVSVGVHTSADPVVFHGDEAGTYAIAIDHWPHQTIRRSVTVA